jgi:hypothetical protein
MGMMIRLLTAAVADGHDDFRDHEEREYVANQALRLHQVWSLCPGTDDQKKKKNKEKQRTEGRIF